MATTDPIAQYAAQTQAALAAAQRQKSANSLGIDEFLTLMTTQLKNQDPLKPLEGTEFVAQLAQFGAVSGIQSMQSSIESLASSLRSTQVLNGATLVGHEVVAQADSFTLTQGVPVSGEIDVPVGASSVQIRITDSTRSRHSSRSAARTHRCPCCCPVACRASRSTAPARISRSIRARSARFPCTTFAASCNAAVQIIHQEQQTCHSVSRSAGSMRRRRI
jgi:hypothetical protein